MIRNWNRLIPKRLMIALKAVAENDIRNLEIAEEPVLGYR